MDALMRRRRQHLLLIVVCWLCGVCHYVTDADQTKVCTLDDRDNNVFLCGNQFSSMLSTLCYPHGYNKRAGAGA